MVCSSGDFVDLKYLIKSIPNWFRFENNKTMFEVNFKSFAIICRQKHKF